MVSSTNKCHQCKGMAAGNCYRLIDMAGHCTGRFQSYYLNQTMIKLRKLMRFGHEVGI